MRQEIQIVDALPSDAHCIGSIQTQTWLDSYSNPARGILREDIEEKIREWDTKGDERIASKIQESNSRTWVAKDQDRIVGFAGALKTDQENKVEALHILPKYQNLGIGTALLEKVLDWLGDSKKVTLEVVAYNTRAQKLYKKFGFSIVGEALDDPIVMPSGKRIPKVLMIRG